MAEDGFKSIGMSDMQIVFVAGKDPGEGLLRIVGNFHKMGEVEAGREISFKELYEVMFSKGRSTFVEEYIEVKNKSGQEVGERQFRIVGLTNAGRPILVVFTPRDGGAAKRIITAWQVSETSDEYSKLLRDCPHLAEELRSKS